MARAAAVLATTAMVVGMTATAGMAARKPRVTKPTLTASVGSVTNSPAVTFTFHSVDATGYTCALDGKRGACASPKTYSGLANGSHTFSVVGTKHGARSSVAVPFSWTIDRTPPPGVTFHGVPTAPVKVADAPDITFSSTESSDTFSCRIDQGTAFVCSPNTSGSTKTGTITENGIHSLTVVATDPAGNVGPVSSTGWEIDDVGPSVVINDAPGTNPFGSVTIHFTVVGADAPSNAVTCSVDNGSLADPGCTDFASGSHSVTIDTAADGSYTLSITATDRAGNQALAAATWTKSATAHAPPILSGPPSYIRDSSPSAAAISWVAGDDTYQCKLDSGSFGGCHTPFTKQGAWAEGPHTVSVSNLTTSSAASSWSWTLDQTVPALTVTGGPGALTNATSATFGIRAADDVALASLSCRLSHAGIAGPTTACPVSGTFATTAAGFYALQVVATDAAGNATVVNKTWSVDTTAPVLTVSGLASLTGPIKVTADEPVSGLAGGSVALVVTDTAANVPATRTCHDGAGKRVSCATTFRSVWLRPSKHLTPGQHYTLDVASLAVHDLADNGSASVARAFRAARTLEENSVAAVAKWQTGKATGAFGGSFVREHVAGAQASYAFRGRSITWMTVTGPSQGKAVVRVDGHKKPVVNNYAASAHYRVARTFGKLGTGDHHITISVLGRKGATAGRGTYVAVDAFKVGTMVAKSPALATTWKRIASAKFLRGHAAVGDLAGEGYALTFRGTSLTWRTLTSRSQGIARVYLDGTLKATVDNYSASAKYRVARTLSKLADRVHTVRIVVSGRHHSGATGNRLTIDRFVIG